LLSLLKELLDFNMQKKVLQITYAEYSDPGELDRGDRELVTEAATICRSAYAPYSGFRVGAAVRLSGGVIVRGTNVENAAFPSGICAEQNALSNCVSNFADEFPEAIAIVAMKGDTITDEPVSPCGNCRQVIAEEEIRSGRDIRIIMAGSKKILIASKCSDLLPLGFSNKTMNPGHSQ